MKCAEQVRNVYGQVQMWKAIYRYNISTIEYKGYWYVPLQWTRCIQRAPLSMVKNPGLSALALSACYTFFKPVLNLQKSHSIDITD